MADSSSSALPPNAVVVATTTEPGAVFIRQLRAVWPEMVVVCLSSVSIVMLVNQLAPTVNDTSLIKNLHSSQFFPNPVTSNLPIVQQFRAACKRIGVTTPRYTALESYVMARLAINALERTRNGNFTQEAFLRALYTDSYFNFNGFRFGPFYPQEVQGGCNQGMHMVRIVQTQPDKSLVDVYSKSFATCGYQMKEWKKLTFGQSCSFTGTLASMCGDFREGLLASFKLTNDAGGIRGNTRLALTTKDDFKNPRIALMNNYEFLEDPDVFGLIGTSMFGIGDVVDLVIKSEKLLFGSFAGSDELRTPFNPRIINYRASVDDEVAAIVHHCYYAKKFTKISVLYEASDFGKYCLETALQEKRWELHSEASFATSRRDDVRAAVKRLFSSSTSDPQAVLLFSLSDVIGEVMLSIHERNPSVMLFGISATVVGPSILQMNESMKAKVNMKNFFQTTLVPNPHDPSIEVVAEYTHALKKSNPLASVSVSGLEGFIVGQMLAISLTRIIGQDLTADALLDTLYENGYFNIFDLHCGPMIRINSNTSTRTSCNQCMKNVYLTDLNGTQVEVFSFDDTCMYEYSENLDFQLHSTRMIMVVLAGLGIAFSLAVMALLVVYRANPHITSISMRCSLVTSVGALLCYVGVFVLYPVPTDSSCALEPWVADIAFVLLLGPIFAKLYHIDMVAGKKTKKKKAFKQLRILPLMATLFVVFVIFLVVYMAVDKPRMQEAFTLDGLRFETCDNQYDVFVYVDYGLKGIMLLWGCLLCQRVSSIQGHGTRFHESKRLMLCMYHTSFLGVCILLSGIAIDSYPTIEFMFMSSILVVNTSVVMSVMCARPVMMAIRRLPVTDSTSSYLTMNSDSSAAGSPTGPRASKSTMSSAKQLRTSRMNLPVRGGSLFDELPEAPEEQDKPEEPDKSDKPAAPDASEGSIKISS